MTEESRPTIQDVRVVLRRNLEHLFNEGELRTLCFDKRVDYDSLGSGGKADKARELVALADRNGWLMELEAIVRRMRPASGTTYSYERVQELHDSILAISQPDVRDAFVEFTQQIEAYLDEFGLLHTQLEEWKEIHNLLQDLQNCFAPCRSYTYALDRLEGSTRSIQRQRESMLYKIEVDWRPCKRCLQKLEQLASSIHAIGEPYDSKSGSGPDWFTALKRIGAGIDDALQSGDTGTLGEQLPTFGDRVDQSLYLADRALRDVVNKMHALPHPGSYVARLR